ncbi:AraC family transcriptional regulator [Paenibacillus oryzisoli]|uniref:helix-turn-helix transcriptional regulator n=1 Tax=Paenibacillus oryzisoli TaxID=1850517 RepID=UPI003D2766C4
MIHVVNVKEMNYPKNWEGYKSISDIPHHLLMFVEKGECSYWINDTHITVKQGEVLFIGEQLSRQAEPVKHAHTKLSIHWTGDGLFQHFSHLQGQALLFRTASLYNYLKQTYAQMFHIWTKKDMYYKTLCESMLLEVAVRVHQEHWIMQSTGKQARVVQQVRDYIMEYFREPLSIEELAQLVQRNPSYLITSFKSYYGMAPIEYMHRARITKAEELLLTTETNVETIAIELGYCDVSYFNRMFKKLTGMTPSSYRRQL